MFDNKELELIRDNLDLEITQLEGFMPRYHDLKKLRKKVQTMILQQSPDVELNQLMQEMDRVWAGRGKK